MISASSISMQFGGRYLFKDISFRIGLHDRIGLVGPNGAGKSTLLKILVGDYSVESGQIARAKFVNVGYLPQEGIRTSGRTLYAEAETVFSDVLGLQRRIEQLQQQLGEVPQDTPESQELLELYGELQHRLEDTDAFRMQSKIEKVLMGLGFREEQFKNRTEEFSGGWQMRIELAKLLLLEPALLLLDEPTNHLDLESLQWLEDYLRNYEGAVIIVSHDRRFLDNMTRRIFELSRGTLIEYTGNFSAFLAAKARRREQQIATYKNQQQQIKQTERFIERFRYKATKARQVQSRIKALEKLERVELEDDEGEIRFSFPPAPRSGKLVMELKDVYKRYGSTKVFEGTNFDIHRGDRIAFVGTNGAGKSTLARIIAGGEPLDAGERVVGHNVSISYFAQHQAEELDPTKDVLGTVEDCAVGETRLRLRTLLGCFLFKGDDVFKRVGVLSGGEKSRLALAKMLLQSSNLIVLDEPTNHLDMRSKGILQEALRNFDGSCIIVSHDRDFLDPLVTKVVEFRDRGIRTYEGNLSDYAAAKHQEVLEAVPAQTPNGDRGIITPRERKRREAEDRQKRYEKMKPLKDSLTRLEAMIEQKENRRTELEQMMGDPELYKDGERAKGTTAEYQWLERELLDAYYAWNNLIQELEALTTGDQR